MGVSRWKKVYVESIPVVQPPFSDVATLCRLVDEAQSAACSDKKELVQIEKQIDTIIYETCGISAEEAKTVDLVTKY